MGEVNTSDSIGLFNPRPDTKRKDFASYYGFNPVNSTGIVLKGQIGKVKITNTVSEGGGAGAGTVSSTVSISTNVANALLGTPNIVTNSSITSVSGLVSAGIRYCKCSSRKYFCSHSSILWLVEIDFI